MDGKKEKGEKRYLSQLVKIVWAAQGVASIVFLAAMLSYLFSSFAQDILWIQHGDIPLYIGGLAAAVLIPYLAYIEVRYRSHFYILGEHELVVEFGVFNVQRDIVPYIKIQNANVTRDIIERVFGVGTLRIETAGGNPGEAEAIIPFIRDYEKVHAEIFGKIEEARRRGTRTHF